MALPGYSGLLYLTIV